MEAILKRFDDAVKELLSHPRVVVTHYRREVAASETEINRLKGSKSLCDFYRQTNGLQLLGIQKDNKAYSEAHHQPSPGTGNDDALPFDYCLTQEQPFDFVLMIPSISQLLCQMRPTKSYNPESFENAEQSEINFLGKSFSTVEEFEQQLVPFDIFQSDFTMSLVLYRDEEGGEDSPLVLIEQENSILKDDTPYITNIESYLELIIACRALTDARTSIFPKHPIYDMTEWQWQKMGVPELDKIIAQQEPSYSRYKIHDVDYDNLLSKQLNDHDLAKKQLSQHAEFINNGGGGGRFLVSKITDGLPYTTACYTDQGKRQRGGTEDEQLQLDWSKKAIPKSFSPLLRCAKIQYANFHHVYAKGVHFKGSNVEGSCFTDSMLANTIWRGANLTDTDFSRSDLRNANFEGADLAGADFEDCDLSGAKY